MDVRQCYRILELPEGTSMDEISHAYHFLKRIYGDEQASVTALSMDEFSPKARGQILEKIEAAYKELSKIHNSARPAVQQIPDEMLESRLPMEPHSLRKVREAKGVTLEHIAAQTCVRLDYLRAIEDERFCDLPLAAVNIRGFLAAYVAELGFPTERIVTSYMQRYLHWQERIKK